MADRQIHPFNKRGIESSCETQSEASWPQERRLFPGASQVSHEAACAVGSISSPGRRSGPPPPAIGAFSALGDPLRPTGQNGQRGA